MLCKLYLDKAIKKKNSKKEKSQLCTRNSLITISKSLVWTPDHVFASAWISNRHPQLNMSETRSPLTPKSIPAELQRMDGSLFSHVPRPQKPSVTLFLTPHTQMDIGKSGQLLPSKCIPNPATFH